VLVSFGQKSKTSLLLGNVHGTITKKENPKRKDNGTSLCHPPSFINRVAYSSKEYCGDDCGQLGDA